MLPPRNRRSLAGGGIARLLSEQARAAGQANAGAPSNAVPDIGAALRSLYDQFSATMQSLGAEAANGQTQTGEIPLGPDGRGRAVFGYTVRVGLDGVRAEPFGDAPPAPGAARAAGTPKQARPARAPITDVFEEGDYLRIVAELPGASADAVRCTLREDGLALQIETASPPLYAKTVALPAAGAAESLQQSCANGILEVRLARRAAP